MEEAQKVNQIEPDMWELAQAVVEAQDRAPAIPSEVLWDWIEAGTEDDG